MFTGTGIVEEGHLTGYVSAEQVVAQLRKYRFISRDNLHHLQSMVMRLDDTELYFRCIQYLKHNHDIVFFYQEQEQIRKSNKKENNVDVTNSKKNNLENVQ